MKQPHIHCDKGDVNDYCIIMGKPERVERAAKLLDNHKLISENRGFMVYNGECGGVPVTLVNSGIGGPSAAIVIEELVNCGAKTIIRVGSGAILRKEMRTGDLVISTGVCKEECSSIAYAPKGFAAIPDFDVTKALIDSAEESGNKYYYGLTMCTDAFYTKGHRELMIDWSKKGVIGSDMESSILFTLASIKGFRAGFIFYGGLNVIRKQKHSDILKQEKQRSKGEINAIKTALNAIKKLSEVK